MNQVESRLALVRERMDQNGLDALLVLIDHNRHYLSGFTADDHQFDESAGALLITPGAQVLATDSRFEVQAMREAPQYEVVIYRNGLAKELPALADRFGFEKLGVESMRLSVQQFQQLQSELKHTRKPVELIPLDMLVEYLRQTKDAQEIELTRQSLMLAEDVFQRVVKTLRPGMTEKMIAWEMEKGMREAGADELSFPVIVAGGPNSAMPHAVPSDREIRAGEPILFDWGARLNGYCSDISRTVIIGPADEMFLKVHDTVREAQKRAITAIKAGVSTKVIDAFARDYIHKDYDGKFGHGLGHGTGLAVHEAPRLSPLRETTLEIGMIVTVEPGIYLPEWGGVRIENQVVVGQDGAQVLNRMTTSYDIKAY